MQFADFQHLLRRERDSNPRRCDPQRFSRPPQSTTLPSLLIFPLQIFSLGLSLQILLTDFLCGIPFAGLRIARRLSTGLQSYELFFGLANFPRFSLLRSDTNALITSSIRWLAVVHEAATGNQEAATGNQVLATGQRGSDGDGGGDVGVRVVAFETEVFVLEVEDGFYVGIYHHFR